MSCSKWSVVGVAGVFTPLNGETSNSRERGFSSMHSGGAFFLVVDGSVRFVSESIEGMLYSKLGSYADGEIVTSF